MGRGLIADRLRRLALRRRGRLGRRWRRS